MIDKDIKDLQQQDNKVLDFEKLSIDNNTNSQNPLKKIESFASSNLNQQFNKSQRIGNDLISSDQSQLSIRTENDKLSITVFDENNNRNKFIPQEISNTCEWLISKLLRKSNKSKEQDSKLSAILLTEWVAWLMLFVGVSVFTYSISAITIKDNSYTDTKKLVMSEKNYQPPIFSPAIAAINKNPKQTTHSTFTTAIYQNVWTKFLEEFQAKNYKVFKANEIHPRLQSLQISLGIELHLLLTTSENQIEEIQLRINTLEANNPFKAYQRISSDLLSIIGGVDEKKEVDLFQKLTLPEDAYQITLPYLSEYQDQNINAQISIEDPLYMIFRIKPGVLRFNTVAKNN